MKSRKPKVAHEMLGKPLVRWVIDAARAAGASEVLTVVGHEREQVLPLVADPVTVVQEERMGTGHALLCALPHICEKKPIAVLCGDTPLLQPSTIAALVQLQQESGAAACVLTCELANPTGYGRIIRDEAGDVLRIVEEKDATAEQREVREVNSGVYCFEAPALVRVLDRLGNGIAQGEYYLTDVIELLRAEGRRVLAQRTADANELLGINDRVQLSRASHIAQRRINEQHMLAGVTMLDPAAVWIGPDVEIARDVELLPQVMLTGNTTVGEDCVIGPNSRIHNSEIGACCIIEESIIEGCTLDCGVSCGPRAYLRPGTVMMAGSKAGTHVEIKNSTVGPGSKVPHLSYMGDATLGADVNVGAGSITCNYDGFAKHPTIIGDRVFVGSDTMFVAPVRIGSDAVTGAGSVITRDVPANALAIERTDQRVVEDWSKRHSKKEKPKPDPDL
jgi:bifunctional UDP-N-acetylglucosamine pyrophosphorylase/glucosamine-1-phosphate N-acetyltransferase